MDGEARVHKETRGGWRSRGEWRGGVEWKDEGVNGEV